MFAAALLGQAALSTGQEDKMTTALSPMPDGHGVAAGVNVKFDNVRELPGKLLRGIGSLFVTITQPIHLYHRVQDNYGGEQKVWLPFYRIWGENQGDSVVGIVYDNRASNGIGGTHWFAGYGNEGWQDKGGKIVGLALLIWSTHEALEQEQSHGCEVGTIPEDSDESDCKETPVQPVPEPEPENEGPIGSDGEGGPVGI